MATQTKTRAQTYHEEVEALKADGMSNAEAVRRVAERHGKSVSAVRGSLYQYRTQHTDSGGTPRRSRRPRSVEDHMASARQSLEQARDLIDREVEEAKVVAEKAQSFYAKVASTAESRKADIEQRIAALS
jgi:transposase